MNSYKKYLNILREKKLFSKAYNYRAYIFSYAGFSTKDQAFFVKRLSFLIKSGVPMLESMHLIRKQTNSKSKIKVFEKVIADIANGQSLAASLGRFRKIFGNFSINIIRAGESSGTLIENLFYLADELKKKEMLKKKIMSALLYPIIITMATIGITSFLALYIFPKIVPIFRGLKARLPFSTRAVLYITDLLRHDGVYIILGLGAIVAFLIILIKKKPRVRFIFDGLILRAPFAGKIAKSYNLTNACRTLGLLLKSGLSLNESLLITADTIENTQYKKSFKDFSEGVIKGKTLSELMDKSPALFPAMLGHMVAIGEKSGNLSNTLLYLSEFYENEFEDTTKNLSSAIEPVLMIIMGVLVGFIAISIITPIYSITQNLHA